MCACIHFPVFIHMYIHTFTPLRDYDRMWYMAPLLIMVHHLVLLIKTPQFSVDRPPTGRETARFSSRRTTSMRLGSAVTGRLIRLMIEILHDFTHRNICQSHRNYGDIISVYIYMYIGCHAHLQYLYHPQ